MKKKERKYYKLESRNENLNSGENKKRLEIKYRNKLNKYWKSKLDILTLTMLYSEYFACSVSICQ